MNLLTMRRALLAMIAEIRPGRVLLRYCSRSGEGEEIRDVPGLAPVEDRSEPAAEKAVRQSSGWYWNLCLDDLVTDETDGAEAGRAGGAAGAVRGVAPPRLREVLEYSGPSRDAEGVLQDLSEVFTTHWGIEVPRIRWVLDERLGWNGNAANFIPDPEAHMILGRSIRGGSILRDNAVDLRFERFDEVERADEDRGCLAVHVLARGDSSGLSIQFEPHRLFASALDLPSVAELPPFEHWIEFARERGVEIPPESRACMVHAFRAWAQILNRAELFSHALDGELDRLKSTILRLVEIDDAAVLAGGGMETLHQSLFVELLDRARALEDELCGAVIGADCEPDASDRESPSLESPQSHDRVTTEERSPLASAGARPGGLTQAFGELPDLDRDCLDALRAQPQTEFVGDEQCACEARVLRLIDAQGEFRDYLEAGSAGWLVTQRSCLLGDCGGLASDRGQAQWIDGYARVHEVQRITGTTAHAVTVEQGCLRANTAIDLIVERGRRLELERNFTAAAALLGLLGQARDAVPELDEAHIDVHGFDIDLWAQSIGIEEASAAELECLRGDLERQVIEWVLRSEWIDPAESLPSGQSAVDLCTASDLEGRRYLYLGTPGWVRSDSIAVPNSSHLVLVQLATPTVDETGILHLKGCAGRKAVEEILAAAPEATPFASLAVAGSAPVRSL